LVETRTPRIPPCSDQFGSTGSSGTTITALKDERRTGHSVVTEPFLVLTDRWRVAADDLQWILQHRTSNGIWRGVSYVTSAKRILERCMRETGVPLGELNPSAYAALKRLPDTFQQWRQASTESVAFESPGPQAEAA